ncbi:MAG: hypothetical protein GF398_10415 [Chitinivibrionales bacterium]|nr:hypothetical protein [Chitinivibrionales bacterium]
MSFNIEVIGPAGQTNLHICTCLPRIIEAEFGVSAMLCRGHAGSAAKTPATVCPDLHNYIDGSRHFGTMPRLTFPAWLNKRLKFCRHTSQAGKHEIRVVVRDHDVLADGLLARGDTTDTGAAHQSAQSEATRISIIKAALNHILSGRHLPQLDCPCFTNAQKIARYEKALQRLHIPGLWLPDMVFLLDFKHESGGFAERQFYLDYLKALQEIKPSVHGRVISADLTADGQILQHMISWMRTTLQLTSVMSASGTTSRSTPPALATLGNHRFPAPSRTISEINAYLETRLIGKLSRGEPISILSTSLGYAQSILTPIRRVKKRYAGLLHTITLIIADSTLKPHHKQHLGAQASRLGIGLCVLKGQIDDPALNRQYAEFAPYDLIFLVNATAHMSTGSLLTWLKTVRHMLAPGGNLVCDYRTASPTRSHSRQIYTRLQFNSLLSYCGYQGGMTISYGGASQYTKIVHTRTSPHSHQETHQSRSAYAIPPRR